MSKKCIKCGAELDDNVKFCDKCGEKQEAASTSEPAKETEKTSAASVASNVSEQINSVADDIKNGMSKNSLIGIVAAAAVAVVVLVILCALLSGGAKSTVKDYMKAFRKGNAKKLVELTYPKDIREDYFDESYGMETKEYIEEVDGIYDAMWKAFKDEGKIKFDYEVKESEKIGKLKKLKKDLKDDFGIKDLDDFRELMEEAEEKTDFDADKIKKAYAIKLKYSLEVDGDKVAKDNSAIVIVYKYKGSWYILNAPLTYSSIHGSLDRDDFKDVIEEMDDASEDLEKAFSEKMKKKYDSSYSDDDDED